MDKLIEWGSKEFRECLLVKGARQVGKTFIIEEYLRRYHPNNVKIDFSIDSDMMDIFNGNRSVDRIVSDIALSKPNFIPIPNESVIFLDEIQLCPKARSSLKSFAIDGRYRVIASGSLLGLSYGDENIDILPMGYEKTVELRSMDFEEFLWAIGIDDSAIGQIRRNIKEKEQFSESTLAHIGRDFNIYMAVGGMPEVVNRYIETNDVNSAREVQKKIISGYRDDIRKYAEKGDRDKIAACFDSIPVQLSQDNKKFKFAIIDSNFVPTFSTYESGINWMSDAEITERAYNLTQPANPLAQFVKQKSYKVYVRDTGLLTCMLGADAAHAILKGDKRVNRGAIAENIVAQCLSSCGHKLYYFSTDSLEIDFITTMRGMVTALEVKSGNNNRAKSLKSIFENYGVKRRIKFEDTNTAIADDGIEHYPFFVCAFADSLYEEYDLKIEP